MADLSLYPGYGHVFTRVETMRSKIIFFFVLCLLLVSCADAGYVITNYPLYTKNNTNFENVNTVSFDATQINQRIALIQMTVPMGSYVNFTIYYGMGKTITGSSYSHIISVIPWIRTQTIIELNGSQNSYDYLDQQPYYDFELAGYARDDTTKQTGFLVYDLGYGTFDNDLAVFSPVNNIGQNTIYRIDASGSNPFSIFITSGSREDVSKGASQGLLDAALTGINDWVQLATTIASDVYNFVIALMYWIKFFFIDNLGLTVSLYMALTLGFAARANPGKPDKILRTWFSDQRKLYQFIIETWNFLVNIIGTFRGIFRI